ncbi:hypothetical protein B0H13DRAFT_1994847 [Mycena leptocephala]|nr:hypothetical protein B0H13DRAFT_1994847 [Mycena leptocephala]
MDIPAPARQRVQISTGDLPSQKLDLVFPANGALQAALSALQTSYVKATMELARLVAQAGRSLPLFIYLNHLSYKSTVTALSFDSHSDDVWCLDPRGLLTLHLAEESYQTLGITGKKLPFKNHSEHSNCFPPLQPSADSVRNRQKREAALQAWDVRRKQAGKDPWTVLYCANDVDATAQFASDNGHTEFVRSVKCQETTSRGVRMPTITLPARPTADADAVEDWEADMGALFEWVGMACSCRLQANDRADAYVAVYQPPQPSTVGDITRLRWRGFLGPDFVQSVIDAVWK